MTNRLQLSLLLLFICVAIAIMPLIIIEDSEFGGADGNAEEAVGELAPNYEPWAANFLEPPGGETESLLFSLQAALGAGVIGYGFGYLVSRHRYSKKDNV